MWCSICAAVGSRIQLDYMAWWLFSTPMSTAAFSQQPSSAVYLCIWISRHLWICQSPFADSFLCIGNHCSQPPQVMLFSFSLVRLKQNLFFPYFSWMTAYKAEHLYLCVLSFFTICAACRPLQTLQTYMLVLCNQLSLFWWWAFQ